MFSVSISSRIRLDSSVVQTTLRCQAVRSTHLNTKSCDMNQNYLHSTVFSGVVGPDTLRTVYGVYNTIQQHNENHQIP